MEFVSPMVHVKIIVITIVLWCKINKEYSLTGKKKVSIKSIGTFGTESSLNSLRSYLSIISTSIGSRVPVDGWILDLGVKSLFPTPSPLKNVYRVNPSGRPYTVVRVSAHDNRDQDERVEWKCKTQNRRPMYRQP